VDNFRVDEAELSGGSPSLLIDERNPNASWLALSGASDETELAALSGSGERLDELGSEPVIRDADVLAAAAGRLLIARPHGLSIELSVLACQPGPRRPSGAAEKSRPAAPP
jgi:hypothetical protein